MGLLSTHGVGLWQMSAGSEMYITDESAFAFHGLFGGDGGGVYGVGGGVSAADV